MQCSNDSAMADEADQLLKKWGRPTNSRDDQPFYQGLFSIIKSDPKAEDIFLSDLNVLLASSHRNLDQVFEFCLSQSEKRYTEKLVSFLADYFDQKKSYFLSFSLEKYLIHEAWKPKILTHALAARITPKKIIVFLSLKMRSLDLKVRKEALCSLFNLVQTVLGPQTDASQKVCSFMTGQLQTLLPSMIEKQRYGKEVNLNRGVILQILQDEFCDIKKKGIQFLGLSQSYFDIRNIRPLILYMLNDEHQIVRETSLAVLSNLPGLELQKEDLNALLVCLRENNIELRSRTYANITHITVTTPEDFLTILSKLFEVLVVYKEDKRKVYTTCGKLGAKYPHYILDSLDKIYKYIDSEEPNWKSLTYKAKVILVASIGQEKWPKSLPKYFRNHYLYIRDIELYAFEGIAIKVGQQQISGSQVTFDGQTFHMPFIRINSAWQLRQYLAAYSNIYTGFIKEVFNLCAALIELPDRIVMSNIGNEVQRLRIQYNTEKCMQASQIVGILLRLAGAKENGDRMEEVNQVAKYCVQNEEILVNVDLNVFKTRSYDRSKVLITNNSFYIHHSFLQFSSTLGAHVNSPLNAKNIDPELWTEQDFKFIRMSEVEFEQTDERFCYFTIDFKWKRLRCLTIYGDPLQIHTTDVVVVL